MSSQLTVGRITFSEPRDPWEALDALQARYALPPPPPGSFTVAKYGARYGLSRLASTRLLDRMAADGVLMKQHAIVEGKRANVYWIPETQPSPPTPASARNRKRRKP
jgi:hypothetical protein